MYCSKCGNKLVEGSNFCIKCGNEIRYNTEFVNSNAFSNQITTEEFKLFVGAKKQQYYISKWLKFGEGKYNSFKTWNWSAFFLTFFWLAYRKMYLYAIGISATFFVLTEILPENFSTPLGIGVGITLGLLGNKLYYDYSEKEITKINNNLTDLGHKEKAIINKGGISIKFATIFTVVYLSIAFTFGVLSYYNLSPLNQVSSIFESKSTNEKKQIQSNSEKFIGAFLNNDFKTANEYMFLENSSRSDLQQYFDGLYKTIASFATLQGGIKAVPYKLNYKIENINIVDNQHALVQYSLGSNIETNREIFEMTVVNQNGTWKVNFMTFSANIMGITQ